MTKRRISLDWPGIGEVHLSLTCLSSLNLAFVNLKNWLQDELARVFVTLFDAKHLLSPLLWNMFYREVEVSDCMQTLFRGNSLGSKIMAFCFKIYGATYLQNLLEPLIRPLLDTSNPHLEVDPARYALFSVAN